MNIDTKITELFDVLRKQKADLEQTKKEIDKKWVTNCSILVAPYTTPTNIQTANETTIHFVVKELLIEQEFGDKASKLLGLEVSKTYRNYSYEDWFQDCSKRIAMIQLTSKKNKIAELENRLNGIVSPEQRRQLELEAITKELNNKL